MLRSLTLADLLTLGNASCGTVSLLLCLQYVGERDVRFLWAAFALLPLAFVLDALDGRVARWRSRQSLLGGDLDSLADIVSFGVAPAALGFTLGLRGGWDAVVLAYFVVCGIARLARYNVTAAAMSDERGKVPYFEGTPIPTSLAIVLLLFVLWQLDLLGATVWLGEVKLGPTLHPLVLVYALSGTAMISARLRIPKP